MKGLPTLEIDLVGREGGSFRVLCRSSFGVVREESPENAFPSALPQRLCDAPRTSAELLQLGRQLFHALFVGDLEAVYRGELGTSESLRGTGRPSRLRIVLNVMDPELAACPWELLYDPVRERFLAADGRVSLARDLAVTEPIQPMRKSSGSSLRLLALFPRTSGLEVDAERRVLEEVGAERKIELHCLGENAVTTEEVHHSIAALQPDVLHFSGHGSYGQATGLLLDGNEEIPELVDATSFARIVSHTGQPPAVAVISACEGGLAGTAATRSVATALLRHGVLGVVAMQTKISNRRASMFSEGFYRSLASSPSGDFELAVGHGRSLLLSLRSHDPAFASPVLYLRGREFELWSESQTGARGSTIPGNDPSIGWARDESKIERGEEETTIHNYGSFQNEGNGQVFQGNFHANRDIIFKTEDPKPTPRQLRSAAERHLEQKEYSLAAEKLAALRDLDDLTSRDLFHSALAILAGRRVKRLSEKVIAEVEALLLAAFRREPCAGYRLGLAAVKHDFYVLNGLREQEPTSQALISHFDLDAVEDADLAILRRHLKVGEQNPLFMLSSGSGAGGSAPSRHHRDNQ